MNGRLANLVLWAMVPLAAVSGLWMFLLGSGSVWPVAVLHGALGLAIIAVVPWKSIVVRRGLRRGRRPGRALSLVLTAMVAIALVTGVVHRFGGLLADSPISTMQVHVGAGLIAAALTLSHARDRRVRTRRGDLSRRTLLRVGAIAAAGVALEGSARVASTVAGPRGIRRPTGSFELASSSVAAIPVTQWLFDQVPQIAPTAWRVTVTSGGTQRDWSLADLGQWHDEERAVLDCTGGWWTEQTWSGVRVSRLLPSGATGSVVVTSSTGYSRRLPLTDHLLLATAVGDASLGTGHGAPARLVVPGRRGYHWVKWVVRIDHDAEPWWVQSPLPLQ